MRSRQSSRDKETITKHKAVQHNYQSARDNENNQKLANLLNLSQFNLNLNDNQIKSNATFFGGINNKANLTRKSPAELSVGNLTSNDIKNSNNRAMQNYLSNGEFNNQLSPSKAPKSSKTRRSKSTRRHLLSCHQILNIAKKRDTCSSAMSESHRNNTVLQYSQSIKPKKKNKKQQNQNIKNANTLKVKKNTNAHINEHANCSLNQSKIGQVKRQAQEIASNFVNNYPLSMSHSYIVFSEKDSSLNNTANILGKMSKKLSTSSKLADLMDKLEIIKVEHAATIIQKNWRGYLTRKLLQDYIVNQESILATKLSAFKAEKQQNIMSKKIQQLGWQQIYGQCSDISEIHRKADFNMDSGNRVQSIDGQDSVNNMNNKTISSSSLSECDQDEQLYKKQEPVMSQLLHTNEIQQSILQFEQSQNLTSRTKFSKEMFEPEAHHKFEHKLMPTQITSRTCNKINKIFKISEQYSQSISTYSESQLTRSSQTRQQNKKEINVKEVIKNTILALEQNVNGLFESYKKQLSNQVKNSQMQFNAMLQIRENMTTVKMQIMQRIKNHSQNLYLTIEKIPKLKEFLNLKVNNEQQQQDKCQSPKKILKIGRPPENKQDKSSPSGHQQSSQQSIVGKRTSIPSFMIPRVNKLVSDSQSPSNILEEDNSVFPNQSSPISQYFTIELPTQQLSPHKSSPYSSGLESLKTYLHNLNQECLQQSENSSQTSFLCKVLKKHTEMGPENMIQRCLIQMLVEMLTGQFMIEDILMAADLIGNQINLNEDLLNSPCMMFVKKWADELDKWELGPIEEVSCNMEESANITQRSSGVKINNSPHQ